MLSVQIRKYVFLLVVAGAVVALDQYTKWYILGHFYPGEVRPVFDCFNLTLVFNTGGAFGFLAGASQATRMMVFNGIVIIAIIVIIIAYHDYASKSGAAAFYLALILGGAVGNLIDRFRLGKVVDFLDFYFGEQHWPSFNVADVAITAGIILFIIYVLFEGVWRTKKR